MEKKQSFLQFLFDKGADMLKWVYNFLMKLHLSNYVPRSVDIVYCISFEKVRSELSFWISSNNVYISWKFERFGSFKMYFLPFWKVIVEYLFSTCWAIVRIFLWNHLNQHVMKWLDFCSVIKKVGNCFNNWTTYLVRLNEVRKKLIVAGCNFIIFLYNFFNWCL